MKGHSHTPRSEARLAIAGLVAVLATAACGNVHSTADIARAQFAGSASGAPTADRATSAPTVAAGDSVAGGPTGGPSGAAPVTAAAGVPAGGQPATSGAGSVRTGSNAAVPGTPSAATASTPTAHRNGQQPAATAASAGAPAPAPPPVGAGSAGGCPAPKPPVVIGTVGTYTGLMGPSAAPGLKALQAWVAATNAAGGIDCHPIRHLVADDGFDPARHLALLKQFVEHDGAIAIVYISGAFSHGQAAVDYVNQRQIPVVGSTEGDTMMYSSPMHFAHMASNLAAQQVAVLSAAKLLQPEAVRKVATITCQEATFCNQANDNYKVTAEKLGFEVVSQQKASLTQPDFTSACLAAQRAGAQALLVAFDAASNQRIAASCRRVNYPVPLVMTPSMSSTLGDPFERDPNLDGSVVGFVVRPGFLSDHPAIAEFLAVRKRYAPDMPVNGATMHGWSSAKLFEVAARGHLSDTPTNTDILKGLWSVKNDSLGDLTYPLTFTQGGKSNEVVCGFPARIKDGTWHADGKLTCL